MAEIEVWRGGVATWECDAMGHLNVGFYVMKSMEALAGANLATVGLVAAVHTLAMMAAGLALAWAVYRYLGLQFLRRAWFNLDLAWAASLVLAGGAGVWMAL